VLIGKENFRTCLSNTSSIKILALYVYDFGNFGGGKDNFILERMNCSNSVQG